MLSKSPSSSINEILQIIWQSKGEFGIDENIRNYRARAILNTY